jgi:hypothetical protein
MTAIVCQPEKLVAWSAKWRVDLESRKFIEVEVRAVVTGTQPRFAFWHKIGKSNCQSIFFWQQILLGPSGLGPTLKLMVCRQPI